MFKILRINQSVSNLAFNADKDFINKVIHKEIAMQIASKISELKTIIEKNEFSIDFKCEVIVASKDDFWREVEKRAYSLNPNNPYSLFGILDKEIK